MRCPTHIVREQPGRSPPALIQQRYADASALTATRIDERTLQLTAATGLGALPIERIFGSVRDIAARG